MTARFFTQGSTDLASTPPWLPSSVLKDQQIWPQHFHDCPVLYSRINRSGLNTMTAQFCTERSTDLASTLPWLPGSLLKDQHIWPQHLHDCLVMYWRTNRSGQITSLTAPFSTEGQTDLARSPPWLPCSLLKDKQIWPDHLLDCPVLYWRTNRSGQITSLTALFCTEGQTDLARSPPWPPCSVLKDKQIWPDHLHDCPVLYWRTNRSSQITSLTALFSTEGQTDPGLPGVLRRFETALPSQSVGYHLGTAVTLPWVASR
jgi:hypothetical protein